MSGPLPYPVRHATVDASVDMLLIEWYEHTQSYQYASGRPSMPASAHSYRSPGHHDWKNGALDEHEREIRQQALAECMTVVERASGHSPETRYATALQLHARNLVRRLSVWYSPVLPATRAERDVLILEARNLFAREAMRRNLL